jgi:hypothetical protein
MGDDRVAISEDYKNSLRWWTHWKCPLVPQLKIKKADKHNTAGFNFHWLFFRAWTGDAPSIGASVELCDDGLFLRLTLPYLWTGLFFYILPQSWSHKLWRKPQGRK